VRAVQLRRVASEHAKVKVVGTQSYQDALWRVVGPPTSGPDSRADWQGEAALEPEPANRYDRNAVRVVVGGEPVGYLDRGLAARLQPALLDLERRGIRVAVPCYASGGFEWREGGRASVGLVLRFDPEELLAHAETDTPR
jgi:hypothetical protein